jgi:uncharacterized protein YkwD
MAPVLLAVCAAIGWLGSGVAKATPPPCNGADLITPAAEQSLEQFDDAVLCLINLERGGADRQTLQPNPLLQRAALDYADSMEAGRFFSHYGDFGGNSTGSTPVARLRQVGYIRPGLRWVVGENLHWTTGDHSSPVDVVSAWIHSPVHAHYLFDPKFRELGIAAIRGTPRDPSRADGITVASEYGFRKR